MKIDSPALQNTLTYSRIQRTSNQTPYSLVTAKIITFAQRMNPNLSANLHLIREPEVIQPLAEAELWFLHHKKILMKSSGFLT